MFPHNKELYGNLHSLGVTLSPGRHEFKFLENQNWLTDSWRPSLSGNFGNHFIDIDSDKLRVNVYNNLCYPRQQLSLL